MQTCFTRNMRSKPAPTCWDYSEVSKQCTKRISTQCIGWIGWAFVRKSPARKRNYQLAYCFHILRTPQFRYCTQLCVAIGMIFSHGFAFLPECHFAVTWRQTLVANGSISAWSYVLSANSNKQPTASQLRTRHCTFSSLAELLCLACVRIFGSISDFTYMELDACDKLKLWAIGRPVRPTMACFVKIIFVGVWRILQK